MRRRRKDPEVCMCIKYFLFSSNFIFWLIGGAICVIGVWSRAAYAAQSETIGLLTGWDLNPAYILIGIGGFLFLLGFCGCAGAGKENVCVLKGFAIFLSIAFFVQLTFGAVAFLYRLKIKEVTTLQLAQGISNYKNNLRLQKVVDVAQTTFACCGLNGPRDWKRNAYFNCTSGPPEGCSVPYSCCKWDRLNTMCGYHANSPLTSRREVERQVFEEGCVSRISDWFNAHMFVLGIGSFAIAWLHLITLACTLKLIRDVRKCKVAWPYPNSFHEPLYINDM